MVADLFYESLHRNSSCSCIPNNVTHAIKMARRTTHSLIADTYKSANTTITVVMATNTSRIT